MKKVKVEFIMSQDELISKEFELNEEQSKNISEITKFVIDKSLIILKESIGHSKKAIKKIKNEIDVSNDDVLKSFISFATIKENKKSYIYSFRIKGEIGVYYIKPFELIYTDKLEKTQENRNLTRNYTCPVLICSQNKENKIPLKEEDKLVFLSPFKIKEGESFYNKKRVLNEK